MLRYQASCKDREAAEAALDQLLLMTATFSTTWNSTERELSREKPFPCTLKSDAEGHFKINIIKKKKTANKRVSQNTGEEENFILF